MALEDRYIEMNDLIARLRKAGSTWFRNSDLLLLEELIRRVRILQANQKLPNENLSSLTPLK